MTETLTDYPSAPAVQTCPLGAARSGAADLAKGIAVLLMVQVHLMEVFAQSSVSHGVVGRISLFLGGPFVAPVYMAVLGYFSALSSRSIAAQMKRGAALLLTAALLNIGLNFHLLLRISVGTVHIDPLPWLLGVDILFLAGLSILLLAIARPVLKKSAMIPALSAIGLVLITPLLTGVLTVDTGLRYLLAFAGGGYAWSFFPLVPWLAYPLLGYAFAKIPPEIARSRWNPQSNWVTLCSAGVAVALTAPYAIRVASDLPAYYHHGLPFFIWTSVFLSVWMVVLSRLQDRFGDTRLLCYARWLGRNVTSVYIIQWLLIGNIGTAVYRTQSLSQLILWFLLIVSAVTGIEWLYLWLSNRKQNVANPKPSR